MTKKLSVLLMLLVLLVGLTSAQDDLSAIDPSGVTIEYWHEWAGSQEAGMDEIIALFNENNAWGITVEQQKFGAGSGVRENVSAGITSGELPNIAGDAFVSRAQGWFLDGVLVPLDAYVESPEWGLNEEEAALINQDVLDINRPALSPFDGQLLSWPVGISSNVLSVNLDLLAEAGIEDVPQTFEEFREAACAVTELEDTTAGFAMRLSAGELESFILANGGITFDEENDRYDFTNEGAIEAMQYVQDLFNDGCAYIPEGAFANTGQFSLGLNAFAGGSSVGVPFIQGDMDSAELDYNWINTTFPWEEGNRTLITFLRGVAILQGTPEENLASWLFIKYWATDPEAQEIWTNAAQYQPYNVATLEAFQEEGAAPNPQFASFAEALADPEIILYSSPSYPRSGEVSDILSELYSNITLGGMDVTEAAQAAEEAANEVYQETLEELS